MIKSIVALLFLFLSLPHSFGQYFNTQRNWSMNKKELVFGIGATGFLGDLGGADQYGTDFSPKDYDFNATNVGGSIGFRYRFHPYYSTTSILNFGMILSSPSNSIFLAWAIKSPSFRSFASFSRISKLSMEKNLCNSEQLI